MRQFQASFIGIGAQKCASTWLYGVLQQCPEVFVSDEKEVDFFSYYFDRGYEWYERNFASETAHQHRGEISPSYFIHADAPARAAAYNPNLHVFVTLRDPIKRAFSNHLHEARKGHISGVNLTFETALDNNPLYRDQGRYATHLSRWMDHFPREQIHVMFQEEILADRATMARQATDILGLKPLDDFLDLKANESVRYRNAAVGETLWKVGSYARRHGMGRLVETVKSAPGIKQMRNANRESMRDAVVPMAADTEAALTDYYAKEVTQLEALIKRPVPWERFRATETA
ncbi:hypothetical protein NBRC116601_33280 [Cognatishimia sp. WU-CL00825]|uniref:sulfotransferase domain-containing protein n=1 Tax=Cognatishimia sp. WU-CL00825 TaxID=3127658 RepID=UPI0031061274